MKTFASFHFRFVAIIDIYSNTNCDVIEFALSQPVARAHLVRLDGFAAVPFLDPQVAPPLPLCFFTPVLVDFTPSAADALAVLEDDDEVS